MLSNTTRRKKKKTKLNCAKQIRIFWKRAEVHNYIHEQCEMSLAQLNHGWCSVSYFLHSKNIQCLPFDHRQSCPSSMNLTFLKHPRRPSLYISNTWSYCSRSDRNFPEAHGLSTNKQATRREKKHRKKNKTEKDKERREKTHQLSIWRMTSFVPSLSFLSHLLGWTESPLSPFLGWLLHSSPWRHLFPLSLSLLFLSLFLSVAAIFLKLYELVTTPFFFPHLLSYFLISAWMRIQHLPLDKLSVSLSICLSTATPPPTPFFPQCLSGPKAPWEKYKMKLKKKKNYIEIFFFEKKVSALAFVNEMQLWIEWPHTPLPPPPTPS